jgi:hypothetical protein
MEPDDQLCVHSCVELAPRLRNANVLGCVGLACVIVWWIPFFLPKHLMETLFNLETLMVPVSWITVVGMFVLPVVAAKRGSKWWLVVTAASAATLLIAVLRSRPLP